jgi:hypothetical protein
MHKIIHFFTQSCTKQIKTLEFRTSKNQKVLDMSFKVDSTVAVIKLTDIFGKLNLIKLFSVN